MSCAIGVGRPAALLALGGPSLASAYFAGALAAAVVGAVAC